MEGIMDDGNIVGSVTRTWAWNLEFCRRNKVQIKNWFMNI
jgi:hypothetical protein